MNKNLPETLHVWLSIALVVLVAINSGIVFSIHQQLAPKAPPVVKLAATLIEAVGCAQCTDLATPLNGMGAALGAKVTVKTVAGDGAEGKALIAKHDIKRLPAIVLSGDVDKLEIPGVRAGASGAQVFDITPPPYWDVATAKAVGLVSATILTKADCTQCTDLTATLLQLKKSGVVVAAEQAVPSSSAEGLALLAKYHITAVPTLIFSADAAEYDVIKSVWTTMGSVESDGMLVLRHVFPPYYALNESRIRGLVDLTYVTDSSCPSCYNASLHRTILQNSFGVQFKTEKTVDITSAAGQQLKSQYKLLQVPTILMSGDTLVYPGLAKAWIDVGSIEPDGTWVFRHDDLLSGIAYHDLASGKIVNATGGQ